MTLFVFVDFENVPTVDLASVEGRSVHVTLLIGKSQTWLDLSLVRQIHRMSQQVDLIEVGASGRNALDLTLATYLGRAIERSPGASFAIVSKDKDFDAMVSHWHAKGVAVVRETSLEDLPFLAPPKSPASGKSKPPFKAPVAKPTPAPKPKASSDKYSVLLEQIKSGKNRPGTRAKLMHHIHTLYGQKTTPEQLTEVIDRLSAAKVLTIDGHDKVVYS